MSENPETIEVTYSDDEILYYLVDEDDNEVGFVILEDGQEVECYYEGFDSEGYEAVDTISTKSEFETVELEYSDDDIAYYLVDENDNEVGFVIIEDGKEVECYYEEYEELAFEPADKQDSKTDAKTKTNHQEDDEDEDDSEEHGYIYKIASIASHEGNKARKKAEKKLGVVRGKAEVQVEKATKAVTAKTKEAKKKADEFNPGITREDISEMTKDLNAIAKEGVATAKDLKETYDDIMDSVGFLIPKKIKRKLPR